MRRFLIIDGSTQLEEGKLIPHTSFDSLARAKRFLMSLEDEAVYIKDHETDKEWYYVDGRIVQEEEII
jgi:hypothetical protein